MMNYIPLFLLSLANHAMETTATILIIEAKLTCDVQHGLGLWHCMHAWRIRVHFLLVQYSIVWHRKS